MEMSSILTDTGFAPLAAPPGFAPLDRDGLARQLLAAPGPAADPAERMAVTALLPRIAAALDRKDNPAAALAWLDAVVCRVPLRDRLFARLLEAPEHLETLCDLPERAPRLAAMLNTVPGLAAEWIARSSPETGLADWLEATLAHWQDLRAPAAETMAAIAAGTSACRFAMEMAALSGRTDPLDIARTNTRLADGALQAAHRLAMAELRARHGTVADGELVVLAMGRYGGAELTAQSDLDLVFLFTGDGAALSDGPRPLDAAEYFDRAAVLITRFLASHSVLGPLYEVDTRLRPWGDKGPRACSLACLDRYLGDNAGVWEFMAMMRARPVIGSAEARASVAAIVAGHDGTARSHAVIESARDMRMAIARHKPPRGGLDVKLVHGGLIDLEFAVHVNQLRHGIGCAPGLARAIACLIEAGLVDPALEAAHRQLTAMLIALRLTGAAVDETSLPLRQAEQVARIAGLGDWPSLMAAFKASRLTVQRALRNTFSQPGR